MSKMPQLEYVVRGLKSTATAKHTRLPITPDILRRLKGVWLTWQNQRDASMLWAAVTMCFCGFLHSGEVVVRSQMGTTHRLNSALVMSESTVPQTQCIEIQIKSSKTDPFWMGISIYLGRTNNELCPVAASLDYMVR